MFSIWLLPSSRPQLCSPYGVVGNVTKYRTVVNRKVKREKKRRKEKAVGYNNLFKTNSLIKAI